MVITRTPFRISFFGGGTDYPVWYEKNGGAVLSTTIDKYCYVTCRHLPPFFDCKYRIRYREQEETKTIEEIKHPSVRECLRHLQFERGIEMQHNADLPGYSGLGSSSSFTVGLLYALLALQGKEITKRDLALNAIHVEQKRIPENVGSQDQAAASFGGFNRIDFGGPEHIRVTPVQVDPATLRELQNRLMLFFTGFARSASEVAGEQIRETPHRSVELAQMQAMVGEAEKILAAGLGGLDDFGRLLHESWLLKRGLTTRITTPFIDELYEKALAAGAVGGKLLGAGGGGFLLFYVRPEDQARVKEVLGLLHVPFAFERLGSQIIYQMPNDV